MTTYTKSQRTDFEPCSGIMISQYGNTDYRSWCELEAARWVASGRKAHVKYAGEQCALFEGVEATDNTLLAEAS